MTSHFQPFTILEHSGDLRISARGRDPMEALAHAFQALISQIVEPESVREQEACNIAIEEETEEARFIGFLNEMIFLVDARRWIPARIKRLATCASSGCSRIEAIISGEPIDLQRHQFKYDVKAVTWHDFRITSESGLTRIDFVCDL
jgi:SHS2 domain-containing protein